MRSRSTQTRGALLGALLSLGSLLSGGCEPALEAELIEVYEAEPLRLSPGQRLSLRGEGFPAGRPARLRLSGSYFRPAQEPRSLRVEIPAEALSADRVEARVGGSLLRRLGGRGTFRGALTVLFDSPGSEARVAGELRGAVLDFVPRTRERLAADLGRVRASEALLAELGVGLEGGLEGGLAEESAEESAEEALEGAARAETGAGAASPEASPREPGAELAEGDADGEEEPGLEVAELREGSPAALAGVRPGDRVLSLNGLRLIESVDFVLAADTEEALLEVARPGEAAAFELALPRASAAGRSTAEGLAFQLAALWALIALFWISPLARFTGGALGLGPSLPRARGLEGAGPRLSAAAAALRVLLLSALFTGLPWIAEGSGLSLVPLVLAAGAARLCLAQMGLRRANLRGAAGVQRGAEEHAEEEARARARRLLARLLRGGIGLALVALALGGGAAAAGTVELRGLGEAQAFAPLSWTLSRLPTSPLLLLLLFAGATLGPASLRRAGPEPPRGLARKADDLILAVYAFAAALVFLGGWQSPDLGLTAGAGGHGLLALWRLPRLLALALFALKAWLLWLAMRRARDRVPFLGPRSALLLALGAVAAGAATTYWLWLAPQEELATMARQVSLAFSAISLALALAHLLRERGQVRPRLLLRPAFPFL